MHRAIFNSTADTPARNAERKRRRIKFETLPDLAPPTRGSALLSLIRGRFTLRGEAPHDEPQHGYRPESRDLCATLTVYALNGAVMCMAFPVGFGLLIYNILGGENLRTTMHVVALTGMGAALHAADLLRGMSLPL